MIRECSECLNLTQICFFVGTQTRDDQWDFIDPDCPCAAVSVSVQITDESHDSEMRRAVHVIVVTVFFFFLYY